jgi:hypothetical protein
LIETEVALRKRIESRNLEAHVAANAVTNAADRNEIALDAGEQTFKRAMSAREESVRMPRLRSSRARRGGIRKSVTVEHDDLLEMGRRGFRRCETPYPRANNDGLL